MPENFFRLQEHMFWRYGYHNILRDNGESYILAASWYILVYAYFFHFYQKFTEWNNIHQMFIHILIFCVVH